MTATNISPKDETTKTVTKVAASREQTDTWSAEERAAMQERAQEIKVVGRGKPKADAEADVLAKIAEMPEPDQTMARRLHELIKTHVPILSSKTSANSKPGTPPSGSTMPLTLMTALFGPSPTQ
jgi:hypothetical protein